MADGLLGGPSRTTTTWSFSTAPTVYTDDVCNDAGAGVDSLWATGTNNGPVKRCSTSTSIWDMSGNAAEWTSSCITVLGKQYCRVRGGSYLSKAPPPPATSASSSTSPTSATPTSASAAAPPSPREHKGLPNRSPNRRS